MSALPPTEQSLVEVLEHARDLGFLGPGPIETHVSQARTYLTALPAAPALVVDLGTGGGVPGLALAMWRPDLRFCLVDAMIRRTAFVELAVSELGLDAQVICERAEVLGGQAEWRGKVDVVVTRSLAAPAVTAEYVAPLLKVGGYALIAEPPGGNAKRWPPAGLAELGLEAGPVVSSSDATLQRLDQVAACDAKYPRRVGVAAKRPIFAE